MEVSFEVIEERPTDPDAFTQGFEIDEGGRLFESSGRYGRSSVREVDPETGEILHQKSLDPDLFAEGLTLVEDRLILLTWREETALVLDPDSLEELHRWDYEGEGWGLCYDGDHLLMTDGTDQLIRRDPDSFEVLESVTITRDGLPLEEVNELECHQGVVWGNVWHHDILVAIDPETGVVLAEADAGDLLEPEVRARVDVLNGIAHIPGTEDEMLLTGKLWPAKFLVRLQVDR